MPQPPNKRIVKDVNAIVDSLSSRNARRAAVAAAQALAAKNRNRGAIAGAAGTGSLNTGAIASPLAEVERNFFNQPRTIQTTDGFFTFELRDIESFVFQDANGALVVIAYAQPPETF